MNAAWDRALELEKLDRVDEAVETIRADGGGEAAYWESRVSFLFETRAKRLYEEKRFDDARVAAQSAIDWARRYAAAATSGSEGLMLSAQADQVARRMAQFIA